MRRLAVEKPKQREGSSCSLDLGAEPSESGGGGGLNTHPFPWHIPWAISGSESVGMLASVNSIPRCLEREPGRDNGLGTEVWLCESVIFIFSKHLKVGIGNAQHHQA